MRGKQVIVIGLGISGRSAARFLLNRGASVIGVDQKGLSLRDDPDISHLLMRGMRLLRDNVQIPSSEYDFVVASPGISPRHPLYQAAINAGKEVIGEITLACRSIRQPMIGITGTNGKTTVTLMVAHVLNHCGIPARSLGNIGVPLTAEVDGLKNEVIVAELSSFQLETLNVKVLDAAVLLNITPDHLDRYNSLEEYAKAKFHIYSCLKPDASFYIHEKCWKEYRDITSGMNVKTFGYDSTSSLWTDKEKIFEQQNVATNLPFDYRGAVSHDVENILAAYALCRQMGVQPDAFGQAVGLFRKPPHRIEFVRKRNGVSFFDDSKGTNLDAVMRAVESLNGNVVLIAGGVDKGAAYTPWIESFSGRVRCICAIGEAKEKIQRDVGDHISVKLYASLEEAVHQAAQVAEAGDHILLSPGCASFDMFRDYAHRGNEFKRIVQLLD